MQPLNTALVGYGLGGRCFHAPFLEHLPQFRLSTVLERNRSESLERYPQVKLVRSMEELLQDKSIELVVITTPNHTHFPLAVQALEAGRHVVVDKPMTVSSNEAAALIDVARASGKILSVYQNRRYASDARTIRKLLQEGILGDIVEFEAQYNRYRPEIRNSWKETEVPGSGILFDLGPHLIDQALQLFGLPQTLTADVRKQRKGSKSVDYFDIRLDFGETRVILKAGMLVREQGPRYQIHGTRGSFIKFGDDVQDADAREGKLPSDPLWGLEPGWSNGLAHTEIEGEVVRQVYPSLRGDFGIFYQNLSNTLINGQPLVEKPEHGYRVVKIIEHALESSQQGRKVEVVLEY